MFCDLPRRLELVGEGSAAAHVAENAAGALEGEGEAGDGLCAEVVVQPFAVAALQRVEQAAQALEEKAVLLVLSLKQGAVEAFFLIAAVVVADWKLLCLESVVVVVVVVAIVRQKNVGQARD